MKTKTSPEISRLKQGRIMAEVSCVSILMIEKSMVFWEGKHLFYSRFGGGSVWDRGKAIGFHLDDPKVGRGMLME